MEFVRIKAGAFLMGSPDSDTDAAADEKPQHGVKITKDFYMAKYPVTQDEYAVVTGKNPSQFSSMFFRAHKGTIVDTRRFPVDSVSWDDAVAFCGELRGRDKQGRHYGLPTEAKFEYAQRAGTTTRFSFGNDPTDLAAYAWYNGNSDNTAHGVGTKKPNPWGLYDMDGNIRQWCADRYGPRYYAESAAEDPKGPDAGDLRVNARESLGVGQEGRFGGRQVALRQPRRQPGRLPGKHGWVSRLYSPGLGHSEAKVLAPGGLISCKTRNPQRLWCLNGSKTRNIGRPTRISSEIDQRFENWKLLRAPLRPYFLRSFMRPSRVRKPESRRRLAMLGGPSAAASAGG